MSAPLMNPIQWLMEWYASQCDGDWEHEHGIKIDTVDNPGWYMEVSLVGTDLEGRVLARIFRERSEHDWINLDITDGKFRASGGPLNLVELIQSFADFVEGTLDETR